MTWPTKTDFVDGDVLTAAQVNNIGTNLNEINPTGITDGYVVTADGAGGLGWEAVPSGSFTQIATGTLGSAGSSITSIPSTYRRLAFGLYGVAGGLRVIIRLNNITTTTYQYLESYSNSTTLQTQASSASDSWLMGLVTTAGSYFGFIDHYASSTRPLFQYVCGSTYSGSPTRAFGGGQYVGDINVNRVDFLPLSGTFTAGTYTLWGVE